MKTNEWRYDFSSEKNQQLIETRNISFEEVIVAIEQNAIIDILPHPNPRKYPNQKLLILEIDHYIYVVPYVEQNENSIFLKTIFKHRKLTKQYLEGKYHAKK